MHGSRTVRRRNSPSKAGQTFCAGSSFQSKVDPSGVSMGGCPRQNERRWARRVGRVGSKGLECLRCQGLVEKNGGAVAPVASWRMLASGPNAKPNQLVLPIIEAGKNEQVCVWSKCQNGQDGSCLENCPCGSSAAAIKMGRGSYTSGQAQLSALIWFWNPGEKKRGWPFRRSTISPITPNGLSVCGQP